MTFSPRPTLARTALAAMAIAIPLAAGCSSSSKPSASASGSSAAPTSTSSASSASAQRTSACKQAPPQIATPDWLPADLPLPPGTVAIQDTESPSTSAGSDAAVHRGFFAVPATVDAFKSLVTTQWPAAGYALGRGDSEQGEAEGGYRKGDFGGAYRVRDVYCDATMSELLLTYGKGATTESD